MSPADRGQYIASLATLRQFLQSNPGVEIPTHFNPEYGTARWLIFGEGETDQKARAAEIVRGVGGHWDKRATSELFRYEATYSGLRLEIVADREQVCRRIVTGTREVTETVPDPSVEVPLVEVTKTEEIVEWECEPLLSDRAADAIVDLMLMDAELRGEVSA